MQGGVANGSIFDPLAALTIPTGWMAGERWIFPKVVGELRKEIGSMERYTGWSC